MLIKSQLITQASGSIGGLVGSHNAGGMYFRARTIPVNPGSAAQIAVRNIVAQLTAAWTADLTAAQRTAWQTYADNVPTTNRLGDSINIPASSAFFFGTLFFMLFMPYKHDLLQIVKNLRNLVN